MVHFMYNSFSEVVALFKTTVCPIPRKGEEVKIGSIRYKVDKVMYCPDVNITIVYLLSP